MKYLLAPLVVVFLIFNAGFSRNEIILEEAQEEIIEIKTRHGKIHVYLYKDIPIHRENFIKLTQKGHYDKTLFHRVIKDFMIQGGDPYSKRKDKQDSLGEGDVGYTLPAEFNRKYFHKRGVIAAARNGDDVNPERRSSGCQFYIVQGRKMTDEDLLKYELRVQKSLKDSTFHFSEVEREHYKKIGGTPWLDCSYTIFGEVISGMDAVDIIASEKRDEKDRPLKNVAMDVNVVYYSKKELLEKFNYTIPD